MLILVLLCLFFFVGEFLLFGRFLYVFRIVYFYRNVRFLSRFSNENGFFIFVSFGFRSEVEIIKEGKVERLDFLNFVEVFKIKVKVVRVNKEGSRNKFFEIEVVLFVVKLFFEFGLLFLLFKRLEEEGFIVLIDV